MYQPTPRTIVLLVPAAVALFALRATTSRAGEEPADSRPSIKDLAWIAGDWRSEEGDNFLQEHWGAPLGDSMMGMFRWVRADKLWITEHLTIVDDGENITYRFRHFGRDLAAWEDRDDPITFDLLSLREGQVVFENPDPPANRPKRIIYTREADILTVRLEAENSRKADVFTFRLNP